MKNKTLFSLIHLLSLYFTLEEYPTWFTLTGVIINVLCFFPLKYKKLIAQLGVLVVIYIHFSFYKKLFDPESASALLSNMLYLKYFMLKDKSEFNRNVILSFLNIAAISLFNSNLFFIGFLVISSFLFLKLLNTEPEEKFELGLNTFFNSQTLKLFIYGLPLATALFFIFPRLPNFFPVAGSASQGKIGYSKDIDNTAISELQTSSQIAFRAQMKRVKNAELYWRGRILNYTNGYNWRYSQIKGKILDRSLKRPFLNYSIKSEQSFDGDIIVLDTPIDVIASFRPELNPGTFYTSYRSRQKISYNGISVLRPLTNSKPDKSYFVLPKYTPKALKKILDLFDKKASLEDNVSLFRNYILKNNFSYTLTPGSLPTLNSFLEAKKGFCTHYASFMAIVFRHLGFATRVVSGFQGGEYNEIGGYYTVRSNDAHAWVEILVNNSWKRFDPTAFISPLRIELGGDGYVNQEIIGNNIESFFGKDYKNTGLYTNYYGIKQWIDNLNYEVALFIESFDMEKQKELYEALLVWVKENLNTLLISLLFFILIWASVFKLPVNAFFRPKHERLILKFSKYLRKNYHFNLTRNTSLEELYGDLNCSLKEKKKIEDWIFSYQKYRYANLSHAQKKDIEKSLKDFWK